MVSNGNSRSDPAAVAYSASPSVPAFIAKLWALVEEESTNEVVRWSENGESFFISEPSILSKDLLPQYFKHNNLSSFIRQLNMYGFRKVLTIEQGGLKNEREDSEFQHSCFVKGKPELLIRIKRRAPTTPAAQNIQFTAATQEASLDRAEMEEKVHTLEAKLSMLQATQDVVNEQFLHLKRENTALWQELANQRQKHLKQQQVTYKLLQFIMHSLVPNASAGARSNPNHHHHRATIHLGKRKLPALMQNDGDVLSGSGGDAVGGPTVAKRVVVPAANSTNSTLSSGPIISEILQRDSPSPHAPASHASALPSASTSPLASACATPPPLESLSSPMMHTFAPQIQTVFSAAPSSAENPFIKSRSLLTSTQTPTPFAIQGTLTTVPSTANANGLFNVADLQAVSTGTLPDGSMVYLLSPAAPNGDSIVTTTAPPSMPSTTPNGATNANTSSKSAVSNASPVLEFRLESDSVNDLPNQPINLSNSSTDVTKASKMTKNQPKITSNHARSLLNVSNNGKSVGKAKSSKMKVVDRSLSTAVTPSIISTAANSAGLPSTSFGDDGSATTDQSFGEFMPYESLLSGKRGMASPSPSKLTTMSPDDLFSTTDVSAVADAATAAGGGGDGETSSVMEPPSFVDVFGLHCRQNVGSVRDAMLSASTSAAGSSGHDKAVHATGFIRNDFSDPVVGCSSSPLSASSALSISSSSANPQNLAVSLSKQIEHVDAGLDSIKDALVSHSSDLQMDPSELLNMFYPEGNGTFTTAPGSPMRWDDLLDLSESAKDALSLALGPQKTLMGPPLADDEDSN